MQVIQVMTREAECINPDATLQEAAFRMKSLDIGALPVWDRDRLVGMVTDRDIVVRSVSAGLNPQADHVRNVMTPHLYCCFEDQDVAEAAEIMRDKQVRRLPVLDRNRRLVGIVSLGDLAVETGNEYLAGDTLEAVSEPNRQNR